MDGFNEKKWFVYMVDHHEGPFSLAEIQRKMTDSQVTSANYVWGEGMPDWKPMTGVPEFEGLIQGAQNGTDGPPPVPAAADEPSFSLSPVELQPVADAVHGEEAAEAAPRTVIGAARPVEETRSAEADPIFASTPKRQKIRVGRVLAASLFFCFAGGGYFAYQAGIFRVWIESPSGSALVGTVRDMTQPYLIRAAEKIPALMQFVSPIPALGDVSADEYEELKAAAWAKAEVGPKIALALSKADVFAPAFYVASNLPDGATIDLYVEGIPDTLLNHTSFATKLTATLVKNLGKTEMLRFPDGRVIPRGSYKVYAVESATQPPAVQAIFTGISTAAPSTIPASVPRSTRLLVSRTYFLGGANDNSYTERLKAFHDKLRARAETELSELQQFTTTLDTQLVSTIGRFNLVRGSLRKGRLPPAQRKLWTEFSAKWKSLHDKLGESFQKWTPEALANDYFYSSLYKQVQEAALAMEGLHAHQNAWVAGTASKASFEIQLGEFLSRAQGAMASLKSKIERAKSLTPTPNGMPQKEGL